MNCGDGTLIGGAAATIGDPLLALSRRQSRNIHTTLIPAACQRSDHNKPRSEKEDGALSAFSDAASASRRTASNFG